MDTPVIAYLIPYIISAGTSAAIGAYASGRHRYRLLDWVPIAREKLVERLRDAVIAIDFQNRIVDLNLAARELIGKMDTNNMVGKLTKLDLAPYRRRIRTYAGP